MTAVQYGKLLLRLEATSHYYCCDLDIVLVLLCCRISAGEGCMGQLWSMANCCWGWIPKTPRGCSSA